MADSPEKRVIVLPPKGKEIGQGVVLLRERLLFAGDGRLPVMPAMLQVRKP